MSELFGNMLGAGVQGLFGGQQQLLGNANAQNQAFAQNQAAVQGMSNALTGYGNGLRSYYPNLYGTVAALPPPVVNYAAEVKEADWERSYREKLEAETKRADEARAKADLMVEELVAATLDAPSE